MATCKFNEKRQRWVVRYYDQSGRRGWESLPDGTTAKQAKKRAREVEDSVEKITFKQPKQIPLFKELAAQWLEAKSNGIRHSTKSQYAGHIENHLIPYFGHIKANEVSLELVERFISRCGKGGMEPNTTRKVLTTMSAVMEYAAHPKRCYATFNPVKYAENKPRIKKREAEMVSSEEVLAIIDQMEGERDKLIVLTGAITGMREGELFGLQWDDIQWKDS